MLLMRMLRFKLLFYINIFYQLILEDRFPARRYFLYIINKKRGLFTLIKEMAMKDI